MQWHARGHKASQLQSQAGSLSFLSPSGIADNWQSCFSWQVLVCSTEQSGKRAKVGRSACKDSLKYVYLFHWYLAKEAF